MGLGGVMLDFTPENHTYRWNGKRVPSVTQIMEDVGIIDYGHIPPATRAMALERGRLVHEITSMYDESDLDEGSVDESLIPYLNAWRNFLADTRFVISLNEYRHYSEKYGYAGQLDRSGSMVIVSGSADILLDIKTNDAPYWTRWQTAAYANFFENPSRFLRMSVELHKDETYRIQEYKGHEFMRDFATFCSFLTTYREKRTCNPRMYRE